jgi:hypothetical protein
VLLIASAARRDPSKRSQRVRRIRGGSQLALRPHDDSFEDLFLLASNSCVCVRVCGFPFFFQALKSVPAIPYMDALPFNLAILDVLVNFTSVL